MAKGRDNRNREDKKKKKPKKQALTGVPDIGFRTHQVVSTPPPASPEPPRE